MNPIPDLPSSIALLVLALSTSLNICATTGKISTAPRPDSLDCKTQKIARLSEAHRLQSLHGYLRKVTPIISLYSRIDGKRLIRLFILNQKAN